MLKSILAASVVVAIVCLVPAADPPAGAPDPAAVAEMMAKLGQVGPEHKQLQEMAGSWDCECRNYEGPGEPQKWKATAEIKSILGGRYQQQEFSGTMPGNIPYSGQGLWGYDNAQQKYVGTWIDSMGTGILHTTGTRDEKTGTATETGVSHTPLGEMQFKMVTEFKSQDEFLFTMSMVLPQGEQKMMEITYRRKK